MAQLSWMTRYFGSSLLDAVLLIELLDPFADVVRIVEGNLLYLALAGRVRRSARRILTVGECCRIYPFVRAWRPDRTFLIARLAVGFGGFNKGRPQRALARRGAILIVNVCRIRNRFETVAHHSGPAPTT